VGYEGMLGMFASVLDVDWSCDTSGFNGSCELGEELMLRLGSSAGLDVLQRCFFAAETY